MGFQMGSRPAGRVQTCACWRNCLHLKKLLAVYLSLDRESARIIAARAGVALDRVEQRLAEMAKKGLILSIQGENGTCSYRAVLLVVGIYEMQVNNLSVDLVDAFDDYWSLMEERSHPETIPQMLTILIGQSIESHLEAMTYLQVGELVNGQTRFAVAPCIYRRQAKLKRGGCMAPEESCQIYVDWADFYARTRRGRAIDRVEMVVLLARADAANLVLHRVIHEMYPSSVVVVVAAEVSYGVLRITRGRLAWLPALSLLH
jgi:hypothetical protein